MNSGEANNNLAPQYALRVALQTMKERCLSLQQMLIHLEDENKVLKSKVNIKINSNDSIVIDKSEMLILREEIAELRRQKHQLNEHIAMVSTENRQLWTRLSDLTKEKKQLIDSATETQPNLTRSKTFTQHNPNPLLRHIPINIETELEKINNSLEDVSLKASGSNATSTANNIIDIESNIPGFSYLVDQTIESSIGIEARKCYDGMLEIKKQLLKQQSDLKVSLSALKERKDSCITCRDKPQMVDKATHNDEVFNTNRSKTQNNEISNTATMNFDMDLTEEERKADMLDKICPMCSSLYPAGVAFAIFRQHVEDHLIDSSCEPDSALEPSYEFISNTVGNT